MAHARKIFELKDELDQITLSVVDSESQRKLNELHAAYNKAYRNSEDTARGYRQMLLAFSGLLVLILGYAQIRMWKLAKDLALVNKTLEDRVERRTAQLRGSNETILQQQTLLVSSAKLSALGEMAGQVAHEINTPLGAIVLTAQGLRRKSLEQNAVINSADLASKMDFILKITAKLARIINSMRQLAGHGANEQFTDICVSELIDDTLLLCSGRFKKESIEFVYVNNLPPATRAQCRANEISQVLVNLLNNAFDATKVLNEKWVRLEVSREDRLVLFRLTDSGRGIAPENMARLFSPQFTTKSLDHGTGFGLSISRKIIERHGGKIFVDETSKNTSFVFQNSARADRGLSARRAGGCVKKILVVEDDEFFRMALAGLLESEGYKAVQATDGKQAIDILRTQRIDCIMSDLQMPIMGGIELAKWVKINRDLPLILMTGYVESINTLTAVAIGAANILYKPFSDQDAIKAVEEALGISKPTGNLFAGFSKVARVSLVANSVAEYNLFENSNGELRKIVSKGEPFYLNELNKRREEYLFTETENLNIIGRANLMVVKAVAKSHAVTPDKKAETILRGLELMHARLAAGEHDLRIEAVEISSCYLYFVEQTKIWDVVERLQKSVQIPFAIHLASAAVAVLTAQVMGLSPDLYLQIVAQQLFPDLDFQFGTTDDEQISSLCAVSTHFCQGIQNGNSEPEQWLKVAVNDPRFNHDSIRALTKSLLDGCEEGMQSA